MSTRSPADLRAAVRHLRRVDAALAAVIRQVGPCRLELGSRASAFHALAEAIVYQQITGRAAAAIFGRLRARAGRRGLRPADILGASDAELRAVGLSRQKIRYLRDLAAQAVDGLGLHRLGRLDDEAVIAALTGVQGIGRWTAEMFLIFRLGRLDVLPVDDLGVRKGFRRVYGLPTAPDAHWMRRTAEPWRPYRSVGSWYLWRSTGLVTLGQEPG